MIFREIQKNNKGQNLIELVVAISIILIGVVSTLVLTVATIRGGKASEMQTIAGNLAREGIEVVKQHRYNNWLKIESNNLSFVNWDDGLYSASYENNLIVEFDPTPPASWSLNFNIDTLTRVECLLDGDNNCLLYIKDGIYSHDPTGVTTSFHRVLTINPICLKPDASEEMVSTSHDCLGVDDEKIGLQVISEVSWQERNNWTSVIFEDHIYNWK
jgi:hypothetical protein